MGTKPRLIDMEVIKTARDKKVVHLFFQDGVTNLQVDVM